MTTLVWFRQDLRLSDNPAFALAARRGPILPVFILDEGGEPGRPLGGASRWWLHHSLTALAHALGGLLLRRGDARVILPELVQQSGAQSVCWNRCYEPYAIARDQGLKKALEAQGAKVDTCNGSLLHEPWEVKSGDGRPFKIYTPFWRACLRQAVAPAAAAAPAFTLADFPSRGERLEHWRLLPRQPDWATGFASQWTPGEHGARARLREFLAHGLADYARLRDRPDRPNVSRLSPHLHWGEISPRQIWSATRAHLRLEPGLKADAEKFLAEIGWREFAYHLLFHFPNLPHSNWKREFDLYPWQDSARQLRAWQRGQTGYPFVDAGLRELWATGYMHNRVRMVVASFLVKHLRIDWRAGERWFWDTLLDADLANNVAGWQWVAGSGADAAPYFRIFHPIEQGRKFDPDGNYVRRWCPELARLPTEHLHAPFDAPPSVLEAAGVVLGKTYALPLVEHRAARQAALDAYAAVKRAARESSLRASEKGAPPGLKGDGNSAARGER